MTMAGLKYCQTAQTVWESENKQAVFSTPGGWDGDARKFSIGTSLICGSRGTVLLFPSLWGTSSKTRWKGGAGRAETLPTSCQVTGMEKKQLGYSDTQLDFKTNSGGKKMGLNSSSIETTCKKDLRTSHHVGMWPPSRNLGTRTTRNKRTFQRKLLSIDS